MKKIALISLSVTLLLLSFSVCAFSQPQNVRFNKMVHDFGDILLTSGHHSYTFTFENTGPQPIVIQTVVSSCGCATPVWTRSPIMPGKSGNIEVTFLNDQGPYPFDKSLTAYITGEPRPIVLRIRGVVHERAKSLSELFPEKFGDISLRRSFADLGGIARGETKRETIEIANTSKRPIEVTFTDLSPGLSMKVTPKTINPGQKGEVEIAINTSQSNKWGQTDFTATFVVNGNRVAGKNFTVKANIRDNFSSLTKEQTDNAPLPMASASSHDFGRVSRGTVVNTSFTIQNLGRRDLIIHTIDTDKKNITTKFPSKIAPGQSAKIDVKIETSPETGDVGYVLSLITNSPARPVMNLIITGYIIN